MGAFVGGLTVAGALARRLDRDLRDQTWLDLVTLSAASFKAARTIARDDVTSFLREPLSRNDFLQAGFAALTRKSNELEQPAS